MISTPFEITGIKTSFEEEVKFWDDLVAASPRVSHTVVGTSSVMDRPMRFISIGEPAPVSPGSTDSVMITATIHGSEAAPREMAIALARDLAFTTDPEWVAYLAAHPLYIMPTCNPDTIESGTRTNAAGYNINRDHLVLSQGETLAIANAIHNVQPSILWDAHEYGPGLVLDMMPIPPSHPQISEPTRYMGEEMRRLVETTVKSNGWSYGPYTFASVTEPRMLCNAAGLIHSMPSFTPETPYARDLVDRIKIQRQVIDAILRWHNQNADRIRAHTAESKRQNILAGKNASARVELRDSDVVLYPPPLGYIITDAQYDVVSERCRLFGIQTEVVDGGHVITMAQEAQPVIPLLFDPESIYRLASGERIVAPKKSGTPFSWGPIRVDGLKCEVVSVKTKVQGLLADVWP